DELLHERAKELLISARQALRTNWNIDRDKATLKVLVGKLRGLETEDPASGKVALIGKIKRNIHENYSKDIDLFSVSEALMKNPNYLSHLFCEVSGQTFSEYLNSVRIEQAKLKLSQSDDTIYSIARQVGYNSERYFVTIFKKMTDLTPTQFRNRK
ncbi:MAG: helix-turn-helix domain-containing protein, partial [Oscillospiraceae bacterium]